MTKNNWYSYDGVSLPSPSKIRDLAMNLNCDEETKDDLASEAGVKMFKHRKKLKINGVHAWLIEVMTNALHDLHRSSRVKHTVPITNEDRGDESGSEDSRVYDKICGPSVAESSLSSHEAEPDTRVQGLELGDVLRQELAKMREPHRSMICLLSYDMSTKNMARELNVPEGTVKSRTNRARNVLLCRLQAREF